MRLCFSEEQDPFLLQMCVRHFKVQGAVFGEILTSLLAMIFFLWLYLLTFFIRLFNFIKFRSYLERKLAGDVSCQKVTNVGTSFRANLVTASR